MLRAIVGAALLVVLLLVNLSHFRCRSSVTTTMMLSEFVSGASVLPHEQ